MAIHKILKMGDARLLRVAQPVVAFDTDALHQLITDLLDTMAAANGAGLAAPQIGVDLQVVIFGNGGVSPRYPDAPPIPRTVLINPVITPMPGPSGAVEEAEDWEGCLSVPGLRGIVPRPALVRYTGFDQFGTTDRCNWRRSNCAFAHNTGASHLNTLHGGFSLLGENGGAQQGAGGGCRIQT